jgi:hypothetical protein
VLLKKTLVAGTDPLALDAYVAKAYWNLDAAALPYLKMASERGLGTAQFENSAPNSSRSIQPPEPRGLGPMSARSKIA